MSKLKVDNAHHAVGYWGRDAAQHIAALQTAERVLALNWDKIQAMGVPFRVWLRQMNDSYPRSVQCSCWKDTTQQSDVPCLSCYGNRWQPGFVRFGYNTTFYSSIHTDLTLVNVELNKVVAPFRLQLVDGATTGYITTPPFTVARSNLGQWSAHLDAYPRDREHNTVSGEFTIDGNTWHALSLLGTTGLNPDIGSVIQFRVTMSRTDATKKSPLFEILRARYPVIPSPRTRPPAEAAPGEILLLNTWDVDVYKREAAGLQTESEGRRYWTVPLSFFDVSIERDTPAAALGRDHLLEEASGPETGTRYVSTKYSYSRNFKTFTRQEFNLRRIIGEIDNPTIGENLMRVW